MVLTRRLKIIKSKNAASLYVIKSTYENGFHSSKIVEKLGTVEELNKKLGGQDPIEWAKDYIRELNEKEGTRDIIVKYSPSKVLPKGEQWSFNGGYLVLRYTRTVMNNLSCKWNNHPKIENNIVTV